MKTAVSIPDDLFEQAEKLAAERKMTRSALYAEALGALLKRLRDDAVTAELDKAIAEAGPVEVEAGRHAAARRELERDGGQW